MHAVSRNVSDKGRDTNLGVKSDSSSEVGHIGSPGYRADGEASPNGPSSPGQMDLGNDDVSPVSPTAVIKRNQTSVIQKDANHDCDYHDGVERDMENLAR
ncbi:hypothetical protein L1987_16402 [Smallanthus sonchifolius]|uniref:Uncharacterized protein n=1 Tax=Smallanthus sonchifolius TaxID=185202 RepID=A0ACB9J888_9ASTR|nr:hypothetical protein L1987_16402 [Smallanthus sonchifolius]